MKATFNQPPNVIEAAAERAGLTIIHSPFALPTWDGDVALSQDGVVPHLTVSHGSPNTTMRLIGALADDGQDCLLGVTL